jgi:hypothetical protein
MVNNKSESKIALPLLFLFHQVKLKFSRELQLSFPVMALYCVNRDGQVRPRLSTNMQIGL